MTTSAPAASRAPATARPIPREPPVTTAARPSNCGAATAACSPAMSCVDTRIPRTMPVIAIHGAGTLGGTLARTLSLRGLAGKIRLLDNSGDVAEGKALDIRQAGPIERSDTRIVGGALPADLAGADVVLLAGPVAGDAEWSGEKGLDALQQVAEMNRRALIVCAGAGHRELVEQGVATLGIDRRRVIGSAPEALRAAIRAIVALEAGCPASEVSLTVLGAPPDRAVVPWSQATAGGVSLDGALPPAVLARLRTRVAALWPPGPYALAAAAAHVVGAALAGSGRRPTCFAMPATERRGPARALAMPVELAASGVARLVEPPLSPREREELQAARAD
ncbi:MAG: hypothetical protein F4W89_05760 [Acidobacteria bacterium]|nr:hypothetical protein [Acidobacteriota bacterium]